MCLQKLKATTTKNIDLNGYKNRIEIIECVIEQTNKDLGLDISLKTDDSKLNLYDNLVAQVQPIIGKLIYQGGGRIEQLLYKIDVSERNVKKALDTAQETDPAVIFTHLILERELQKVVFRMLYSKGLNP